MWSLPFLFILRTSDNSKSGASLPRFTVVSHVVVLCQQAYRFIIRQDVLQLALHGYAEFEESGQLCVAQVFHALLIILEHPGVDVSSSGKL